MPAEAPQRTEAALRIRAPTRRFTQDAPAAVVADSLRYPADITAAGAFVHIVQMVLRHLTANLAAARAADAEGIHQLRIAIRRMRAALVLFRPVLQPKPASHFSTELRRIGQVFGDARDWDVFVLDTLPVAAADKPGLVSVELIRVPAELHRAAAHDRLRIELDGAAFADLLSGVSKWVEAAEQNQAMLGGARFQRPAADLAPRLIDRIARKVNKRGRRLHGASDHALHEMRKSVKKLRYALEFFAPLHTRKRDHRALRACKDMQDVLGHANDAATVQTLLKPLAAGQPELVPAAETLTRWADKRGKKAQRKVPNAWRKLRRAVA